MERLRHYLFVRHRHNWLLLIRFGLVGATGVLVNLITVVLLKRTGPHFNDIAVPVLFTDYNVRWYHVFSMIAFLVANLWNFQLNRKWTFRSAEHSGWWREFGPFLSVGLAAQLIGLGILTLLMHPDSIFSLPSDILDDSTGFRTKYYWAQLITIGFTVPISFVLNKLWTFSAVRGGKHVSFEAEIEAEAAEQAEERSQSDDDEARERVGP